jgi:hypothetical protein
VGLPRHPWALAFSVAANAKLGGTGVAPRLEQFHFRCVGNRSVENNFGIRIP